MNHFIDAFILQAKQNPDSPAVLDCEGVYSYGELNHRSAYLAKIILDTLKPGKTTGRIALLLPRTKDFIAAWLAVFRAGCTVIPLSSEYPDERISMILKDAQCPLCLTTEALAEKVPGDVATILLSEVFPDRTELPAADLYLNRSDPDAEGMIYYTSGSTGSPKGVVHRQRILDAYPELLPQLVSFSSKTRTLCIAMFTFAASLMDLTPPLYYGGSIYIANETERKDINRLYEIMKTGQISGIFMPPTMYGTMRQIFGVLPVDYLFVSGEKAMPQHMYGDSGVFELYGASECPPMLANPLGQGGPAVLGKPFNGVTAFLKDENGRTITERNTIGELCIITPYMATEYHNMPEETSKKFSMESGKQVYHTGDYMAYDLNGNLVFHGRKDRMVKIRGQRVELDEIDYVMCRCDGINESKTVEVNVQNAARLCCYYTGRIYEQKELKRHAEKYLADYMIPDYFIHLEEMPRNARGKADLQALKQRKIDVVSLHKKTSAEHSTGVFTEPDVIEKRIRDVFAEVLDLPSVDPDDEFSEIGGTSMLAMQAVAKLEDLNITMKDIFALKTPQRLAEMVQSRDSNTIEQRIRNVFAEVLDLPSVDPDDEFSEIGGTSMLAMQAVAKLEDLNITIKDIFELKTPQRLAEMVQSRDSNTIEQRIRNVFAEVLDLPSVNPDDEFSEIGGTSMLAMQAVAKLEDLNITIKDIFELKTPRRLAKMVQSRDSNTIEQRIRNVFAEVLDLPSVDPDDEFSEIGGTSMLAMQAVAKLKDLNITMKDIYALKTPQRLAEALLKQSALQVKTDFSADSRTSYPLLPYQRYYVDYQLYTPKGDGTNVPILKAMPRSEIEPEELKRAVDTVLHHFSIFGMIFTFGDEGFVQQYEPERIQPVEIIDTSDNVFNTEILPHLLKPHKVINSLLYRCAIYVTETTVYLFMDFHHSIIDGTSISLVIKNIIRVLHGEPPEKDLYFKFLRQHIILANRKEAVKELERLKKIYNLPSFERMPRVDHQSRDNQIHILKVPFSYSYTDLMDVLQEKSYSLGMLYSAAGLLAMKEYNNTDKVQVQWIYNGRDESWKENIIGITMSAHPIAIDFSRPELNLMKEVSAQIIDSIVHSDLSFALYDNSPNKQETINMICEDGIEINTSVTPGSCDIPMWDYRVTSPAAAECVLYPAKKETS